MEYLTIASKDNHSKALRHLGTMYLEGFGVEENKKKAFELFKKSSRLGNNLAHSYLADFYLLGLGGQKKNYTKTVVHLKLANIKTNIDDLYNINILYKYKRLPKDSKEYYNWLLENLNNFKSTTSIKRLGYFAKIFLKDYSEAYKWYYICSSKIESNNWNQNLFGLWEKDINKQCSIKLGILEKEFLSKTEIKEAKVNADKWTNKYMN